jgi:hypothetical protein
MKLKSSCTETREIKEYRENIKRERKKFANNTFDKGLIFKYIRNSKKSVAKKKKKKQERKRRENTPVKKWAIELSRHFLKENGKQIYVHSKMLITKYKSK